MFNDTTTRNLVAFDSMTEMANWANDNTSGDYNEYRSMSAKSWNNNTTWEQAIARAGLGYDKAVPDAQKLLSKLEASISIESIAYESSVAGCFPVVAEYLAGEPECMLEPTPVNSEMAPLAIYIDLTTSYNVTSQQFHKRGVAVLALAMLLSQIRPISLHVCTVMHGKRKGDDSVSLVTSRIETAPLDLARAAYALTDVAVARRLFYAVAEKLHDFNGMWPELKGANYAATTSPAYTKRVRELLDLDSDVLYIPAVCSVDSEFDQMVNRPVDWINKNLALYGGVTADH